MPFTILFSAFSLRTNHGHSLSVCKTYNINNIRPRGKNIVVRILFFQKSRFVLKSIINCYYIKSRIYIFVVRDKFSRITRYVILSRNTWYTYNMSSIWFCFKITKYPETIILIQICCILCYCLLKLHVS